MGHEDESIPPAALSYGTGTGRRRGRPVKGEGVDWAEIESVYVTSTYSLEKLADMNHVSRSAVLERSGKGKWVSKRDAHRRGVQQAATALTLKTQSHTIAQEEAQVSALAHGVLARLAQNIAAKAVQAVTCPDCGFEHSIDLPRYDITVSDLVQLLKARQVIQGDPGYVAPIDPDGEAAELRRIESLDPDQVRDEVGRILREAESYDIG